MDRTADWQELGSGVRLARGEVSGSTPSPATGGSCGNANPLGDGLSNTTLDRELAAVQAIRAQAITEGTVGQTCTLGNAASPATTLSCADDGAWVLTLTARDGVNPPVTSSMTLHLANVAPTVALSDTLSGLQVTVTGQVADPGGANDTQTCSFASVTARPIRPASASPLVCPPTTTANPPRRR